MRTPKVLSLILDNMPEICKWQRRFITVLLRTVFALRGRLSFIKGRALDNVFVERLWRSVKYEDLYIHDYADGRALYKGLVHYFSFYNHERFHQSLNYLTPAQVHLGTAEKLSYFTAVAVQ